MTNIPEVFGDRVPIGRLDQIAFMLEQIAPHCASLYNGGRYRMTPEECKRMAEELSRIRVSHSQIRDVLKLFEELAKRPAFPELVHRVAVMEYKPLVPAAIAKHSAPEGAGGPVLALEG